MTSDNADLPVQDELASLKARADLMGIKYHPSIGVDALRAKVNAAVSSDAAPADPAAPASPGSEGEQVFGVETENQRRQRLQRAASALVRIRLTCMNPLKKEFPGEIITVGNDVIGTFKKFIPFNADEGYHVPVCILEYLREKQCQVFKTVLGPRGEKTRRGHLIKEYAIELLPALTPEELHDLAQRQAMAGAIDNTTV